MDELKPLSGALPKAPTITSDIAAKMIPDALRPWIVDTAERLQVPIESIAGAAISALSGVVGRKVVIFPKRNDDWRIPAPLWFGLVARPGQKKSAIIDEAMRPLEQLEDRAQAQFKDQRFKIMASQMAYKAKAEAIKDRMKMAAKEGDAIESQLAELDLEKLEKEKVESEVFERRYRTNDATVEKLGELLSQNPNGLILKRDELSGWLKSFDRPGHEQDRAFFLECWNGTGRFSVDRIGRGTIHLDALCLTVLGGIQPGRLEEYVEDATRGGAGDDGLLQRFQLLIYPERPTAVPVYIDRRPSLEARASANEVFRKINDLRPADLGAQSADGGIPGVRFTPDAQQAFESWFLELERKLHKTESISPALESHLSKYRRLVPGLTLIFHLVDRVSDQAGDTVGTEPLFKAMVWADFLEQHARKVYSIAENLAGYGAEALARKIAEGKITSGMTVREIYRNQWSRLSNKESVDGALRVLDEHGWLVVETIETDGASTRMVQLHPKLTKSVAASLITSG